MKSKVLFVEDEPDLGNVVKQYLEAMGFEVDWCINAELAFNAFLSTPDKFTLLLIDVQLPGIDGFELAEQILSVYGEVSFLFLTARNEKKDRIRGLKIGADDYITKPFDVDELVLRMKNIIRRKSNSTSIESKVDEIQAGDIKLNKELLKLYIGGEQQLSLTVREAELLEFLCKHQNKMLKREEILLQLWGENDYFLGRSLDVFISRLRKQLSHSKTVSINNVYGVGFIFEVKS